MRPAACLGYLLARASDTLADTTTLPLQTRSNALATFADAVAGNAAPPSWPATLRNAIPNPDERRLLEHSSDLLDGFQSLPADQTTLVRKVVATIISGQQFDLRYFAEATPEHPAALPDDPALEDYTYRVAGCVGEFWTQLGLLTLGTRFSTAAPTALLEQARTYGQSLQLVNILRDLPADLAAGRCYLPVSDPTDRAGLLACHARWLERAEAGLVHGTDYARALPIRRLRTASLLPALLARETVFRLRDASWDDLAARVKVPRRRVYLLLFKAILTS